MKAILDKFHKYNALNYIKQFSANHLLIYSTILAFMLGFSKKALEILRLAVSNKILNRLKKKYKKYTEEYIKNDHSSYNGITSNKVWVCWFQGFDNAPELVKKCILSQQKNLKNKEFIILTEKNYSEYVEFPDFIVEKINKGVITKTHLSDLLRLELLKKYGGTWIDATVYVSGKIPDYMLESDLFVFQDLKPGLDGHCTALSSWFITAKIQNPIISLTLNLLYEYWKTHDKMIDYFLLHDFFQIAIEAYPGEWDKVIPFSNATPHILLLRLFENYNKEVWTATKNQTPIHKLSYKFNDEQFLKTGTYYYEIFKNKE
ncbi:capsular polysaccharide synthesis protein [Erysipelotrichaceae bacterium 66-17]|nr:capsular polysaccharide biosynthesis protein [Erysipelotrichaceae bacterium OPF54]